jgi:P-type E1-E2 ATPase
LLPTAKLEAISGYRADGPIAMVGNAINDAPALAAASVGIDMAVAQTSPSRPPMPRCSRTA